MFKFDFAQEGGAAEAAPEAAAALVAPYVYPLSALAERAPRISYTRDAGGLPRRDLFDVRYELMAAENPSEEEALLLQGTEDVRTNVYEGGLKVWEGTGDLLEVLGRETTTSDSGGDVMELGCGAAAPICHVLRQRLAAGHGGRFVFADYNAAVLRLLTMPNAVLAWLAATQHELVAEPHGELVLSAELIAEMGADLARRGVELVFVGGAWSPEFSALVGADFRLVLASETVYAPAAIAPFTDVLAAALRGSAANRALVAAKRVYFGVGGGVVEFAAALDARGIRYEEVLEKGSVGRVVLEVQLPGTE